MTVTRLSANGAGKSEKKNKLNFQRESSVNVQNVWMNKENQHTYFVRTV